MLKNHPTKNHPTYASDMWNQEQHRNPAFGCLVQFWGTQYEEDIDKLEGAQQRATRMARTEALVLWGEAGEDGLDHTGEGKAWGTHNSNPPVAPRRASKGKVGQSCDHIIQILGSHPLFGFSQPHFIFHNRRLPLLWSCASEYFKTTYTLVPQFSFTENHTAIAISSC